MASAKLRVLGGKGRNNSRLELWRNLLIRVETWAQAVPDAAGGGRQQDRSEQDKDKRAGHVPQHHKKSIYSKTPRCFLLLKSP